jgi:hypothetical protein
MNRLWVCFDKDTIWLQGRALWEPNQEMIEAMEKSMRFAREIHIDIEYMSCRFSRALYRLLAHCQDKKVYWHIGNSWDVHADLPVIFSEVLGFPIHLIEGKSRALA